MVLSVPDYLQIRLNLLNHLSVFRICQIDLSGIHLEGAAEFIPALPGGMTKEMQNNLRLLLEYACELTRKAE